MVDLAMKQSMNWWGAEHIYVSVNDSMTILFSHVYTWITLVAMKTSDDNDTDAPSERIGNGYPPKIPKAPSGMVILKGSLKKIKH